MKYLFLLFFFNTRFSFKRKNPKEEKELSTFCRILIAFVRFASFDTKQNSISKWNDSIQFMNKIHFFLHLFLLFHFFWLYLYVSFFLLYLRGWHFFSFILFSLSGLPGMDGFISMKCLNLNLKMNVYVSAGNSVRNVDLALASSSTLCPMLQTHQQQTYYVKLYQRHLEQRFTGITKRKSHIKCLTRLIVRSEYIFLCFFFEILVFLAFLWRWV